MKKMKKLVCALLSVTILLSLAACGNTETGGKNSGEVPEIVWYDRSATTRDHQEVTDAINEYIEPIIGAKVRRISIVGSEFAEKLRLVLASNEPADVIYNGGSTYSTYVKNGSFLELDELLESHGKELKEITPDYAIEAARIEGKLYGIPIYKDYAVEHVVRYNKELADKYNFDMDSLKTLADFEPILQTLKENEPNIYPFKFLHNLSGFALLYYDKIMGQTIGAVDLEGDPNTIVNQYTTPKALEYYKLMHKWYNMGFMRKDIATVNNNADIDGKEFMSIEQELPYLTEQMNRTNPYEYGVAHLVKPQMGTSNVSGMLFSIAATSEHPEESMKFINLLNTDKTLRNMASLGIEGKHWVAVGEDFYKLPDGVATKADTGFETYGSPQGNKYLFRMIEGTPADIYDKYIEFDENAIKSPALGFTFDPENVQAEISALNNVYNEFMPSLLTGAADPDVIYPQAVKKFEEAGVNTLIAEIQRQYDEWRENK